MNKVAIEIILIGLIFGLGITAGVFIPQNRNCTITITDFQGAKHVIRGIADNN